MNEHNNFVTGLIWLAGDADEFQRLLQEACSAHNIDPIKCLSEYVMKVSGAPKYVAEMEIVAMLGSYEFLDDRQFIKGLQMATANMLETIRFKEFEGTLFKAKLFYLCKRFHVQYTPELASLARRRDPSQSISSACPFSTRRSAVVERPSLNMTLEFDKDAAIMSSADPFFLQVTNATTHLAIMDNRLSLEEHNSSSFGPRVNRFCTERASAVLEKGVCKELDRLAGYIDLTVADMIKLDIFESMVPCEKAAQLSRVIPFIFRVTECAKAMKIAIQFLYELCIHPGPEKVTLLIEESIKYPDMNTHEFTAHIQAVYPELLNNYICKA